MTKVDISIFETEKTSNYIVRVPHPPTTFYMLDLY